MHGCHANGTNMPGHADCLPTFLRHSGAFVPSIELLETRGGDVRVPSSSKLMCACAHTEGD